MKLVTLPEITVIIMGQSPPSSSYNSNGEGLPFFQGKTDFGDIYPTARAFCTEPNKIAEPNDILMSVRAPVGSTNLNRVRSCIGRGLASIRCSSKADLYYLFYFLRFYESEIINFSRGSTFDSISRDDLDRIRVPLPPIAEQKRIAAICAKADRLRRTRRYVLELSDNYLRSVFLEMFGDPVENPKGWKTKTIRGIAVKFSDGPFGSNLKTSHYQASGIRVIRLQNIGIGELIDSDKAYVSESHFAGLKKHSCISGDVIVGTMGEPNLRACILPQSIPIALNKADCVQLRPDPKQANSQYICGLLNMPQTLHLALGLIHGQTRERINMGSLAEMCVPVPPLPLQEKFAAIVQKSDRIRAQQRESLRQAEHLFQTILHRAFRGEL